MDEDSSEYKIFKDSVHGAIKISSKLVKIIDTPEFQRLRNIKQMWSTYRVYPGASHNRFEHSIGVCYLAGLLARSLKAHGAALDEMDILCVEIAGLCHDLGHGPFSHLFDDCFLPIVRQKSSPWKHEDGSIMMFRNLLKYNKIGDITLREFLGLKEKDVLFVEDLIKGKPSQNQQDEVNDDRYKSNGKKFLFEIVSNKKNGFDVDRFDYFVRDSHHLGLTNSFDYMRYILFARVCDCLGEKHICIRDKEAFNMQKLYITRYSLYYSASQHPKVTAIELMVTDALVNAEKGFKIYNGRDKDSIDVSPSGTGGEHNNDDSHVDAGKSLSEATADAKYYLRLTDAVYEQILNAKEGTCDISRKLLQNLERRKLYVFIGQTQPLPVGKLQSNGTHLLTESGNEESEAKTIQAGLEETLARQIAKLGEVDRSKIRIKVLRIGCGATKTEESDALSFNNIWFYSKEKKGTLNSARMMNPSLISYVLTPRAEEEYLRVYSTLEKDSAENEKIQQAFTKWCNVFGLLYMKWWKQP